jgi:hypothetical protein
MGPNPGVITVNRHEDAAGADVEKFYKKIKAKVTDTSFTIDTIKVRKGSEAKKIEQILAREDLFEWAEPDRLVMRMPPPCPDNGLSGPSTTGQADEG